MVKVRLLQVESDESESVNSRINRVLDAIPGHLANCDFLVLPELWTIHAFNLEAIEANAVTLENNLFVQLANLAKSADSWLHAGTFPIKNPDGTITNTAVIFDNSGKLVSSYSKLHLYGFADGEKKFIEPGNQIVNVQTPIGKTGISICYDLRFPELYREQVTKGADSFLICAGWPTVRQHHWVNLIISRAIENECFVIAVNGRGVFNNIELAGNSMVVDPKGNVIAQGNLSDDFVEAEIDLALVKEWRETFPVLEDRRDLHNL